MENSEYSWMYMISSSIASFVWVIDKTFFFFLFSIVLLIQYLFKFCHKTANAHLCCSCSQHFRLLFNLVFVAITLCYFSFGLQSKFQLKFFFFLNQGICIWDWFCETFLLWILIWDFVQSWHLLRLWISLRRSYHYFHYY